MKKLFLLITVLVIGCSRLLYASPNEDLITAAKEGNIEGVKSALKAGAKINYKSKYDKSRFDLEGDTALLKAVGEHNLDIVKFLLESKADPNIKNNSGDTAIMYVSRSESCSDDELEILKLLIKYKADINIKDSDNDTPLIMMCRSNTDKSPCIEILLQNKNIKLNEKNSEGETALSYSKSFNHPNITDLLIKAGAVDAGNISKEDKYDIFLDKLKSADRELINSVRFGDYEQMQDSIKGGANVNVSDVNKMTPLMIASQSGFDEMVKYLLGYKANVNATTENKTTALMIASVNGNITIVKLLIAYGANVNLRDSMGMTAYDLAKFNNHTEVMYLLKTAGAK